MPYLILVAGAVGLSLIWGYVIFHGIELSRLRRDPDATSGQKEAAKSAQGGRVVGWLIGSAVIVWAMWSWGVQGIQEQANEQAMQQRWFATYTDEHQRKWNDSCKDFFWYFSSDVVYDGETGEPLTEQWCRDQWRPPAIPEEYTTDEYLQPEYADPTAQKAIFGEDLFGWVCTPAEDCYSWDDFVQPPSGF